MYHLCRGDKVAAKQMSTKWNDLLIFWFITLGELLLKHNQQSHIIDNSIRFYYLLNHR